MEHDFRSWLKERLNKKRYIHSLEVAKRAKYLAELHGSDGEKAGIAGLLHDCCHCLDACEQLKIIKSRGILLDDLTAALPQLWHAIAGEITVSDELSIDDAEILKAIRYHTTGTGDMTRLSQVVYLADLTSGDRDYPGLERYREISEKSLERAMFKHLAHTVKRLSRKGAPITRDTWMAYNFFWRIRQNKENSL